MLSSSVRPRWSGAGEVPEPRARRRLALTLVASGMALVLAGALWWSLAGAVGPPGATQRALPEPPVALVPGELFEPAVAVPAAAVPGVPVRIEVPALGVDVHVVPVHAAGRTLAPPSDPFELGWWSDGARPGEDGVALVTGHTVHDGPGALNGLGRLRAGDLVLVRTRPSVLTYRVAAVRTFSQGGLARHARELFARDGPSRLALVTCSDWDGHRYLSNVVVMAVPV